MSKSVDPGFKASKLSVFGTIETGFWATNSARIADLGPLSANSRHGLFSELLGLDGPYCWLFVFEIATGATDKRSSKRSQENVNSFPRNRYDTG